MSVWCTHHLPVEATAVWIQETGGASLQHTITCEICFKPRLGLISKDQTGYVVALEDEVFDSTYALEHGAMDQWLLTLMSNEWIAAQLLGYPFRCLGFWENPATLEVQCNISEIYQDFETALAVGRMRKQLAVYDLHNKQDINIS